VLFNRLCEPEMGAAMLTAWTASQWAHEIGIFAAALFAIGSGAYLAHRGKCLLWAPERALRRTAVETGLTPKGDRDHPSRSFRLLDLLAVVTLVAALAGFVIGLMHEERDGIPPSQVNRHKVIDSFRLDSQAPR